MPEIIGQTIADFLASPTVSAVGLALGVALVALWLAAAWWAYTDAARRTESTLAALVVAGWIVVSTPLLMPFALGIYSLLRPQVTAAEGRTRNLAAELVDEMGDSAAGSCPVCRLPMDPGWLRCPRCTTWLAVPCAGCGSWSEPAMAVCPFCGSEERAEPTVEALDAPMNGLGRGRRSRRPMWAVGPGSQRADRSGRRPLLASDGRPLAPARGR
jgi:hypothetical protein